MLYTLLHTSSPSSLLPSFLPFTVGQCYVRAASQSRHSVPPPSPPPSLRSCMALMRSFPSSLSSPLPQVLHGTDALLRLFDTVGLGWAARISELPIINK